MKKTRTELEQENLDQKIILHEDERNTILKARAQTLAVEIKDVTTKKDFIEIMEFSLASETYGIETAFIREVYPLKDFSPLPGTPPFVLGIINVRGQIISIVDLKKFFNLPEKGLGELNKVIIVQNEQMEFGILADAIQGTCSVPLDAIQNSLVPTIEIGTGYLRGVTSDHTIILDAEKILSDEKIIIHQEAE
ncbi:MAG: purine-binding chemotaxis protein CheW [Melioribacter sp.]|nr:purine-binding chemotaxis protein CheW [Melioribacter sp.]